MRRILNLVLFGLLLLPAAAQPKHKNFTVSVYVRAYEVEKMKDTQWLESTWKTISSQLDVDKIYLETHRDMLLIDDATLEKAKKFFQKQGLEVAGGITYTISEPNDFETFSYSDPKDRAWVQKVAETTARHFDERRPGISTSCSWTTSSSPAARRTWRSPPRGTGAGPRTAWSG